MSGAAVQSAALYAVLVVSIEMVWVPADAGLLASTPRCMSTAVLNAVGLEGEPLEG
ncbi:unannotated protein [freshwater metagenome]|uniref:Unannotated protein n=1 Tax=freshwater metagenome TaxID=449393 RepID=A0A6J7E6K4_9ZZZZ